MADRQQVLSLAWDCWRAGRGSLPALMARQQARLVDLVTFARARSPFFHEIYQRLPTSISALSELPPVTKAELMARFDDWFTDPEVSQAEVTAFVADRTRVGQAYLGRYAIWTTSGTSGEPGVFLHDERAVAIYRVLRSLRGWLGWISPELLASTARQGGRMAVIAAPGRHDAHASMIGLAHRRYPWLIGRLRAFSLLSPMPELVAELNAFQPAELRGFPSGLTLLAQQQAEGRLRIGPGLVVAAGECLAAADRRRIAAAFRCQVREAYGATEFPRIAFECRRGSLHVSADWVILEPVDEHYRPVPAGQPSTTLLLTNLANRVQPIIRYALGDSITLLANPCPCRSPLPAIQVQGRSDDVLRLRSARGTVVQLPPNALAAVIENAPGVRRFQLIQSGPASLSVRLEVEGDIDPTAVWEIVRNCLRNYLAGQGLPDVAVDRSQEQPGQDPGSRKFRRIWAETSAVAEGKETLAAPSGPPQES